MYLNYISKGRMNWKNQFIKRDNIKQHNKTRKYYTLSLYN